MRATFTLLTGLFGDPPTDAIFSETRTIESWLCAEAALAGAQAEHGVIEPGVATEIAGACDLANVDREALWREARNVGYPILPLVRMIAAALSPAASGRVHYGATTQDIMDTGLALQLGEATARLLALVEVLGGGLERLVERNRVTVMAARTHAQQAVPTTFGAKIAVHLGQLARGRERLAAAGIATRCVSLFGAGGTSAALGPAAPRIRESMGRRLGLESVDLPWHVARDGLAEFGFACTALAAGCGRLAREVVALSRTEIAEVAEPTGHHRGASSTMPHKSNPVASEAIIGMSVTAAALSSALFAAMEAGHERGAGEWQVEWEVIPSLVILAAGCLATAAELAGGLTVSPEAMRRNLEATDGGVMSEAYMMSLAPTLGRELAHDRVYEAVRVAASGGSSLADALADDADLTFEPLSPADYVGNPDLTCDAALRAWRQGAKPMSIRNDSEGR